MSLFAKNTPEYTDRIVDWDDERGFGFVLPSEGGDRAFMHISELETKTRRPTSGDQVTYSVGNDSRGRLQAKAVCFAGVKRAQHLPRAMIGMIALLIIAAMFAVDLLPLMIMGAYFVFSIVSFGAYMKDKDAAKRQAWRTPENTLHFLDLLGGWPGGLVAQQWFHHKTVKRPFQIFFWLSVVANIVGVCWLTASGLAEQLLASAIG